MRVKQGVEFTDGKLLSEQELQAFEAHFGYALPPDYREFLLQTNGGLPTPSSFVVGNGLRGTVRAFDPLPDPSEWLSLKGAFEMSPRGTMLIADSTRGVLSLGVDPALPSYGIVFLFYSHSRPGKQMELVARSFDAFLRMLKVAPPSPPPREVVIAHNVHVSTSHLPLPEDVIKGFENIRGYRFPEDYREFMLLCNGGEPSPGSFTFTEKPYGTSNSNQIRAFYALGVDDEFYDLEGEVFTFEGRIPWGTIPIGELHFGNQLLLAVEGDQRGKVFFWDHELEPGNPVDWSNVSPVADSFDALLSALKA